MCGILGIFDLKKPAEDLRPQALQMSRRQRHRGPDWSGIFVTPNSILVHERLAIVDPTSGKQPLFSSDGVLALAVNGEIYNHRELRKNLSEPYEFLTHSDCEIILALYRQKGLNFFDDLNGIFAFALYDQTDDSYLIARDHMGIIPLYMGWDEFGDFYVASELKTLVGVCKKIQEFPPGHYLSSKDGEPRRWYTREWTEYDNVKDNATDITAL
ncbi:MAG TPA: hypothetical protein VGE66_10255, partial [Chitinophagaceae bacterium]